MLIFLELSILQWLPMVSMKSHGSQLENLGLISLCHSLQQITIDFNNF